MKASQRRHGIVIQPPAQTGDIAACTRKSRFAKKEFAKKAAARARRTGAKVVAYECPVCRMWHLTSADQSIERMRRRG